MVSGRQGLEEEGEKEEGLASGVPVRKGLTNQGCFNLKW